MPGRPQIEVLHGMVAVHTAQGLMGHDGTSKIGLRSGFGHGQGHCFCNLHVMMVKQSLILTFKIGNVFQQTFADVFPCFRILNIFGSVHLQRGIYFWK